MSCLQSVHQDILVRAVTQSVIVPVANVLEMEYAGLDALTDGLERIARQVTSGRRIVLPNLFVPFCLYDVWLSCK